jgi:hypothetical protein
VRILYGARSLVTFATEISKYKCDLSDVRKVRWDSCGTVPEGEYTLFYGKINEHYELDAGLFVRRRETYHQIRGLRLLVQDVVRNIELSGRWCRSIVLNIHAPT